MPLDDTLRYLKGHHRMTQEYISEKIGVHFTTYGRYERGEITPPLHVLKKLGDLFEMTVDQLNDFQIPTMKNPSESFSESVATNYVDVVIRLNGSAESLQNAQKTISRIHQALI